MKKLTIIILLLSIPFISCERKSGRGTVKYNQSTASQANYDYYVKVVGISDGDTFKGLTRDSIEINFRLHGIDAPEKKQAYSVKSKEKLSELIFGERVGIKVHTKRDRYGRPVVYVFTSDGTDVGAEMLKSGMAWHFKRYDNSDFYARLEIDARDNKRGLWNDENSVPPWLFREK